MLSESKACDVENTMDRYTASATDIECTIQNVQRSLIDQNDVLTVDSHASNRS